jgi:hypothetical protein
MVVDLMLSVAKKMFLRKKNAFEVDFPQFATNDEENKQLYPLMM